MRIYIYTGGEKVVGKSGVGQAIRHQKSCLDRCGVSVTERWTADTAAVHINTVLPDSVLTALGARLRGKKVVWYGHSTMEDFRKSFRGSDLLAPLFRRWITFSSPKPYRLRNEARSAGSGWKYAVSTPLERLYTGLRIP